MKNNIFSFLILAFCISQITIGQSPKDITKLKDFPFNDSLWNIEDNEGLQQPMDTIFYDNQRALHLPLGHTAYLKSRVYQDFIIEFDIIGFVMPGFGFRVKDKNNYELFYIRVNSSDKKDALQYIPIFNGSLPWQLYNYPKYEAKAQFPRKKVTSLPLAYQEYFRQGKMNDTLRLKLREESIVFSKTAEMQPINDTTWLMGDIKLLLQMELKKSHKAWDVFNQYVWTHIKVEVLGDKASIYVEDMNVPKLVVKQLKHNIKEGGICLKNQFYDALFANVSIGELKVNESVPSDFKKEEISTNYLTKWRLSEKFIKNEDKILVQLDSIGSKEVKWKTVKSDLDGLVNISRFFEETSNTVALRCTISSTSEQSVKMLFDYADHLMIVLNSKVIFNKGLNLENEGRVFVRDENIELNLSKGENDLVLVITPNEEYKQNWGFIAQLEKLEGITIE